MKRKWIKLHWSGWVVGAASSVSHVGSMLFCDGDRSLQFWTHVSVKHDAQFDYSHLTSRVNSQKRENWVGRTSECPTQLKAALTHIFFIRDELACKSPPVLSIWTEFQTRYLYRSIYSWVRLLFRAWSGILMWDLKEEIGGTAWPIHRRAWKEPNSKEEEVHWAGSDQRWPRIKCTPRSFNQKTLGSFSTLPRHIYPSKL